VRQANVFTSAARQPGGEGEYPGRATLSPLQLSKQTEEGWECLLGCGTRSSYLVLKPPAAFPRPSLRGDFPVRDAREGRAAGVRPARKVRARLLSRLPAPGTRNP